MINFHAGYNVFEDDQSIYRLSSGVSNKLEIRMLEEAGAMPNFTVLSTVAAIFITSSLSLL